MNPIRQTNSAMRQIQSIPSNLSNLNLQQSTKRSPRTEYTEVTIEHYHNTEK